MSRERKIFVALASAGLLALVADRVLFAEAEETASGASATVATHTAAVTPSDDLFAFLDASEADDATSWPQRLQRIATALDTGDDGVRRNAFAVPATWRSEVTVDAAAVAAAAAPEADFAQAHRLLGVVPNAKIPCAVVDGTPVLVGQQVDGFTLHQVLVRSAVFIRGNTRVELHLDDLPTTNSGATIATTETQ